ncbi:kunitz-type serine protease inhibitor vestiginin-5 [Scaptodrosophila lebanonensis]|uniref:Kunitz-type serine protease inhibitor vestiginin-5 n=1 Tax=Drosophila lebanonensis TaxID=7225 RepID=A0A6J2UAV7_DROLE|nr:kunitz-type serine protease inhibitor vestiginin-5 [Scaptodrosophila lebanonensis]
MSSSRSLLILLFVILSCTCFSVETRFVATLPNICKQPPPHSVGLCTIEIEGFYYDPNTQDCKMYSIGACRMTPGQSFGSKQNCLATCVRGTRRIQDLHVNE